MVRQAHHEREESVRPEQPYAPQGRFHGNELRRNSAVRWKLVEGARVASFEVIGQALRKLSDNPSAAARMIPDYIHIFGIVRSNIKRTITYPMPALVSRVRRPDVGSNNWMPFWTN